MKLIVTNVDKVPQSFGIVWVVKYSINRDDGDTSFDDRIDPQQTIFLHAFPEEKIIGLVAEYDLDIENMDEVVDLILSEPFLDSSDGEPTLFSGAERSVIRAAHRRRCARAKLRTKMSTRGIQNPVEMIRHVSVDRTALAQTRSRMARSLRG